jgi:hypothetical protein
MTTDDRLRQEREREEAEYEEPGHELTKDTPGLDDKPARSVAGPDVEVEGEGDIEFEESPKSPGDRPAK